MYMQDYRVINDDKGTELPEILTIATSTESEYDRPSLTTHDLVQEQAKDSYCPQASPTVGLPGSRINYDRKGLLVRTAVIDGEVQKVIPTSLQPSLLYHLIYPGLARHPGERPIDLSMQHKYYWPRILMDFYPTLTNCRKCA